jgi:hypothetical protein
MARNRGFCGDSSVLEPVTERNRPRRPDCIHRPVRQRKETGQFDMTSILKKENVNKENPKTVINLKWILDRNG